MINVPNDSSVRFEICLFRCIKTKHGGVKYYQYVKCTWDPVITYRGDILTTESIDQFAKSSFDVNQMPRATVIVEIMCIQLRNVNYLLYFTG